jgi:hypothetical protein
MKRTGLACVLSVQLVVAAGAQTTGTPAAGKLKLQVLEGQAAIHNVRQYGASDIQVQVTDEENHPAAGATVTLQLPAEGAGGAFAKGATATTTKTDARGYAIFKGFRANGTAGKFSITVSASHNGESAQTSITQFNVIVDHPPHKSSTGKVVAIVGIVGAAAAGGAYAAAHKGASPAPAASPAPIPTIGISPGTGVAGPPR